MDRFRVSPFLFQDDLFKYLAGSYEESDPGGASCCYSCLLFVAPMAAVNMAVVGVMDELQKIILLVTMNMLLVD